MTQVQFEVPRYPIRSVAKMTGLSVDTLRAWERRYDVVSPGRNARGRLYSDANVSRLKQLAGLVEQGHAIGTIASLSDAELGKLLRGVDRHASSRPDSGGAAGFEPPKLEPLMRALDRYDLDEIEGLLNRYAAVLPPRDLVFMVMVPLLQEIGRRWAAGKLRPSQEHLVSAIVRSVLGGLLRATSRPQAIPKIVCATPSGERHELGLLCAAVLIASAGWGVVYLGADVPAADILHAATVTGARVVLLSATSPGAVARNELRKLSALPAGTELWIGGPEAEKLAAPVGHLARHVAALDDLIPMLSQRER
jgi:DNA-binding transcriptional MerR regulator